MKTILKAELENAIRVMLKMEDMENYKYSLFQAAQIAYDDACKENRRAKDDVVKLAEQKEGIRKIVHSGTLVTITENWVSMEPVEEAQ